MFGGTLDPPKNLRRTRPKPMTYDIQLPTFCPGVYGHMGRAANTDFHVRNFQYRQRLVDADHHFLIGEAKRLTKELTVAKYDQHAEKTALRRHIEVRFQEKVKEYEESIERRREKLRQLLCQEEQEFTLETIDKAQKGVDSKMQEMKEKAELLKAEREAKRQEIVKQKRMMQDIQECKELRPVLVKQNLIDSKKTHLQQMKENQMRKEAEKEMDAMWYNMMVKEVDAKMEKEMQDVLKTKQAMKETVEVWEKQLQGKELLRQEAERIAAEDAMELAKLREQLQREQIEALDAKLRKRDQTDRELVEQIQLHEKYLAQRKEEERAFNNAMSKLAQKEFERERQLIKDTTSQAKREMAIYRQHLKGLEEERKKEEIQLNALLEHHRKIVEKKQEEAVCKLKKARDELHKKVLAGRAEQLEYKKIEAENQLKFKEAENELQRIACETNERLQAEHDRLQAEKVKEYRDDLKKQIEYISEQRKSEKEQLERELAESLAEEDRRRQNVLKIFESRFNDETFKHPFTKILERKMCPCPNNPKDQC